MADNISQRISLDGADDIKKQLADIGQAGEKTFTELKTLTDTQQLAAFSDGLTKISTALSQISAVFAGGLQQSLKDFGTGLVNVAERTAGLSVAAAGVGAAVLALAEGAGKAAQAVSDQAQAMGVSIDTYQKYQAAAAAAGVEQGKFASGLANLSRGIEEVAQKQKQAAIDLAETLAKSVNTDGNSPVFGLGDAIAKAALQVKQVLDSLGQNEALGKIEADLFNLAQASDVARKQIIALGDATPQNLIDALDQLRDKTTAVGAGAGAVGAALKRLGVDVLDSAGNVRELKDVLPEIADRFAAMPDGVQKSAAAIALFGKAIGPSLIPLLNQGREGLAGFSGEIARLGLNFDVAQTKIGEQMVGALEKLAFVANAAKNQLAVMFAPIITEGANALTKAILDNFDAIRAWATFVGGEAKQIALDFIAVISGKRDRVENKWILDLTDTIVAFGGAITNVVIPKIRLLVDVLNEVAKVFNAVFGENLTGGEILFGAVMLRMIGATSLLAAGLRAVALVVGLLFSEMALGAIAAAAPLLAIAGIPALIIAGFVAAGIFIGAFWDDITNGAKLAWGDITNGAKLLWGDITNLFNAGWAFLKAGWDGVASIASTIWDGIVAAAAAAWQAISAGAQALWSGLVSTFNSGIDALKAGWDSVSASASAAWDGLVSAWQSVIDQIVSVASGVAGTIGGAFQTAVDAVQGVFEGLASTVTGILQTIAAAIDAVISAAAAAANAVKSALSGSGGSDTTDALAGTAGFAGGGVVRGAGTGTSDSIIARVSNGELIVQAEAVQALVRRFGGGILHLINNFHRVGALPAFSLGGLVEGVSRRLSSTFELPGFAAGGMVNFSPAAAGHSQLHPVTIDLGGGRSVGGLFAPVDVVQALKRASVLDRIASGGRSPSRGRG